MTTPDQQLRLPNPKIEAQFRSSMEQLHYAVEKFPWSNPGSYMQWLRDSYEYANNSTRILALAAGVMPPRHTSFSNRFVAHAAEEKGHERLLENDLKALGFKMDEVPPTHEMTLFHQSLYYWLSNNSTPVGLFGWILALEGLAVTQGPWIYEQVKSAHGKKAATFLKVHSEEDPAHLDRAFQALKLLSDEEASLVVQTTAQYTNQYCKVLESIQGVFEVNKASA